MREKIEELIADYSTYGQDEFGYDMSEQRKELVDAIMKAFEESLPEEAFVVLNNRNGMLMEGWDKYRDAVLSGLKAEGRKDADNKV